MELTQTPGICQPGDTVSSASLADKAPAVLQQYFDNSSTFLTQHHINTYESCIFREIPEIILSENPIINLKDPIVEKDLGDETASDYKYKTEIFIGRKPDSEEVGFDVGPPVITLDGGETVRRMFPNEARIRNLTYGAQFRADITIRLTFTSEVTREKTERIVTVPSFPLFQIPVLLRSKLCATHSAGATALAEMGECRNDQGGYFIVDGSEKVLITRQEQAYNTVFISPAAPSDEKYSMKATVQCQNPVTKQSHKVALFRYRKTKEIRVSLPFVREQVPLFAVFRALGVESDKEIVDMIVPDGNRADQDSLIPCIQDAYPIASKAHAIGFMVYLTHDRLLASVLDILNNYLFAHVANRPLARAYYLASIVRKMMRVETGREPVPSRDDTRNQRLLATGTLLRDLFAAIWKDWKKKVVLAIDVMYNYNKTLYKDENFVDIFSMANLPGIFKTAELNKAILSGFRGRWGTNQYNMKAGVIQPVARISYMDFVSHTRRIVSDFDTSLKLTGPRHLHPSQVGYFCTSETPTGAHIGATKNLSMLTTVSLSIPIRPVMEWLFAHGEVIEIASVAKSEFTSLASVQLNGGTVGFTRRPADLTAVLKSMKWTGCLSPMASVSFNRTENIVRIYLDDGRALRPVWHLNEDAVGKAKWPAIAKGKVLPAWRDMIMGTFGPTADLPLTSVAFVDPLASNAAAGLTDYLKMFEENRETAGAIEYLDAYESNEAYISWWGREDDLGAEHTHAEIHPSTMMGVLASMIPYANHNQSPRNQLSCSQSKQAIGYYATNYENRFDTYGSMLCYGEGAICRTIYHDAIAGGAMPYGTNVVFAINSFNGYNQDDGILFNRSSIQRGLFRSLALRSYETVEEDDTLAKVAYRIGNPRYVPSWDNVRAGYDYTDLDDTGIIKEGALIHERTVLVGRFMRHLETGTVKDASLLPTVFTKGRVDKVVVLHQANGMRLVKIRILEERVPELGDKFSTRHGQKGTIGMLLDAENMPRTADGIVPDVMVNPHCIPSRMTMAQMLEQLFGKLGAEIGSKINATSFMNNEQSTQAIGDALEMVGLQRTGEEVMYSGITGKMFTTSVFMGPMNFMRLKHLTQDKMNSRGAGRREMRTHQPTGGRGNEGGMRIGEMERDSLIAHGVTEFLTESMMKRSDETEFWICNGCGTVPIVNEADKMFVCSRCDGPLQFQGSTADTIGLILPVEKTRTTFSRVKMPYAMKLLSQELTTYMNGGFRFLTERNVRKLRDLADDGTDVNAEDLAAAVQDVQVAKMPSKRALVAMAEGEAVKDQVAEEVQGQEQEQEQPTDLVDEGQPSRNELAEQVEARDGQPILYFDSEMNKEFSTYYPAPMTIDGVAWPTAEHFFQAQKFTGSPEYQEKIRTTKNPSAAKTLGKTTDIPQRPDWSNDKVRDTVMIRVQRIKFQNKALADKLLATGNALLRYKAPQDNYWGVGRSGKGQNKLGRILMKIRAELQKAASPASASASAAAAAAMPIPAAAPESHPNAGIGVGQGGPIIIEKVGAEPPAEEAPPAPLFPEPTPQTMGGPVIEIEEIPDTEFDTSGLLQQQQQDTMKYQPQQPLAMDGGWTNGEDVKVIKFE